jgi:hypothetical protein
MDSALTQVGVTHVLIDPLAERGLQMQHCFVASERVDAVARDAFERMIGFVFIIRMPDVLSFIGYNDCGSSVFCDFPSQG